MESQSNNTKASELVKEYRIRLEQELKRIPKGERKEFLDLMNHHLSGLSSMIYAKMGLHHTPTHFPKWMYKRTVDRIITDEGKEIEIQQDCQPDINPASYLDHFAKAKIISRRTTDEGKWKYVSNPYFLTSEVLEVMIDEMKKRGVRFDVCGESNYNPGRSFQIRFQKLKN